MFYLFCVITDPIFLDDISSETSVAFKCSTDDEAINMSLTSWTFNDQPAEHNSVQSHDFISTLRLSRNSSTAGGIVKCCVPHGSAYYCANFTLPNSGTTSFALLCGS